MDFKNFIEVAENEKDVRETLKKLPSKFRRLVNGYKFKFQANNTLKGDGQHVGIVDLDKKIMTVCAPYNFGREHTILHEIGHLVWDVLDKKQKNKWQQIFVKHPNQDGQKQDAEEYFAHAFAATYANYVVSNFNIPQWHSFIKSLGNSD